jgi:hypothetical protein
MKVIFLSLIFFSTTVFAAGYNAVVIASKLNLRSAPSLESTVLAEISYGEKIEIIEKTKIKIEQKVEGNESYWVKVKYKNKIGYVADYYIGDTNAEGKLPPLHLIITLKNGEQVKLQNRPASGESFTLYLLHSYDKSIGYYFVLEHWIEGGCIVLVNDTTGKRTRVISIPVISPNKKRFVCYGSGVTMAYAISGIMIYEIQDNEIVEVYSKKPSVPSKGDDWGCANAQWIDDDTIEWTKAVAIEGGEKHSTHFLRYKSGKWVEAND